MFPWDKYVSILRLSSYVRLFAGAHENSRLTYYFANGIIFIYFGLSSKKCLIGPHLQVPPTNKVQNSAQSVNFFRDRETGSAIYGVSGLSFKEIQQAEGR